MGVYDRDYYRESGGGWWAGRGDRQVVTWLVALNIAAFVAQIATRDGLTGWALFDLDAVLHGQVWRLLTTHFVYADFRHGEVFQLALNMVALYWLGSELEAADGPAEFLGFYLAAAAVASVAAVALALAGLTGGDAPSAGASGPVTAVVALFACRHPSRRVQVFFVLSVPAWLAAVGWVAVDFLWFTGAGRPEFAFGAHLLAAAFAVAYARLGLRVTRAVPWVNGPRRKGRARRTTTAPRSSDVPPPAAATGSAPFDEYLEAKLDRVLEKMGRSGPASLTDEERAVLAAASETYKRRRR